VPDSALNTSQPSQSSTWSRRTSTCNLRVERVAPGPVVELVQPGAEQENQVAEEMAREQEGGPRFRTGELRITFPQYD
jgi:hypothetical protein